MCKKIAYTETNALIMKIKKEHESGIKLYTYQCNCCKQYHLTKYENLSENSFIANGSLYDVLFDAIIARTTGKRRLSNRRTQHMFTINNKQYVYVYNKHTKEILVTAILNLELEME
jgi:hypothetical protein